MTNGDKKRNNTVRKTNNTVQVLGTTAEKAPLSSDQSSVKPWLVAVVSALLLGVAFGAVWTLGPDNQTQKLPTTTTSSTTTPANSEPTPTTTPVPASHYVLSGEVIATTVPLVVWANPGPEPRFGTDELGEELFFEPLSLPQIDQMLRQTRVEANQANGIHTKTVLLGSVTDIPIVVSITDRRIGTDWEDQGADGPDDNERRRSVMTSLGGFSEEQLVARESLAMIEGPEQVDNSFLFDQSEGFVVWSQLPDEVSIATVEINENRRWIRPRAGVAAFRLSMAEGDTAVFRVLDADGRELSSTEMFLDGSASYREYDGPELTDGRFDEETPNPEFFVLDGEVIFTRQPLVVRASPGPEPEFDTSDLGTEIVLEPVVDYSKVEDLYQHWSGQMLEEDADPVLIKFTVLGQIDGTVFGLGISDHQFGYEPSSLNPNTNIRQRWVGFAEGSSSSGDRADRSSLKLIRLDPISTPVPQSGFWSAFSIHDGFGPNTSVVVLQTGQGDLWVRPMAGVAVFPRIDGGATDRVIAIDADGNTIEVRGD